MRTLYLRNVPDEVVADLESLAQREGMSVSAFAVRELAATSRRARNAAILEALPDNRLGRERILEIVREARNDR